MGGPTGKRKTHGNSTGAKLHKAGVRKKFSIRHIDQVWEDTRKPAHIVHDGKLGPLGTTDRAELDEDVPGFGKFYCISCSRYFQTEVAMADHQKTKPHKRRAKQLATQPRPHNQRDAEAAAGLGAPDNGSSLRTHTPVAMTD